MPRSNKWCAHPIFHQGARKSGPGALCPCGNRPIDNGKGPVDGIGGALKYRATRRVLSGRRTDAILTPQELYQFASTDTKINVFYLSRQDIKLNSESMNLSKRLAQKAVKGQIILSNIDKRFPPFFDRLDSRNS